MKHNSKYKKWNRRWWDRQTNVWCWIQIQSNKWRKANTCKDKEDNSLKEIEVYKREI